MCSTLFNIARKLSNSILVITEIPRYIETLKFIIWSIYRNDYSYCCYFNCGSRKKLILSFHESDYILAPLEEAWLPLRQTSTMRCSEKRNPNVMRPLTAFYGISKLNRVCFLRVTFSTLANCCYGILAQESFRKASVKPTSSIDLLNLTSKVGFTILTTISCMHLRRGT
jgi:hypothetical protein